MNKDFFTHNRNQLKAALKEDILIVAAYDKMQQTNDAAAPFKQESNFWLLTGIDMPSWKVVVDGKSDEVYLVRPNLSEAEKIFESWLSDSEASEISGIETVIPYSNFLQKLDEYKQRSSNVLSIQPKTYEDIHCHPNPAQQNTWNEIQSAGLKPSNAQLMLAKLRAIKTEDEVAAIQEAINLTNKAFELVKSRIHTYRNEQEVAADFTYEFMKQGAKHAYDPIVAVNKNACTLHYINNNTKLTSGLLLLDIGAYINGYNADITRTYAVGNISDRHKQVHAAVLKAQQEIIKLIKPGVKTVDYLEKVDKIMKQQLITLGLIKDVDDKKYRTYFPHAISHGLGVDVHDSLGRASEFAPGMVLTVEPGIYIEEEGIGVRIEDDILVTESGNKNLSGALSTEL
jgi:Xaa-Pro aminopeptidase